MAQLEDSKLRVFVRQKKKTLKDKIMIQNYRYIFKSVNSQI